MPTPATRIPDGAVAGDDMRFSPYMNRKAAARSAAPMTSCEISDEHVGVLSVFLQVMDLGVTRAGVLGLAPLVLNIASMRSVTA